MAVVVVIGAGAIGTMLAGRLAAAGHVVRLVARRGPVGAVSVMVRSPNGVATGQVLRLDDLAQAMSASPVPDLAVVAVKGYDTAPLLRDLRNEIPEGCRILTVQNGVGNEEILATAFGEERTVSGALTMPVEMTGPLEANVLKEGEIGLAPVSPAMDVSPTAEVFASSGFRVKAFDDYRSLKWTKLLMNMVANALPAILGWTPDRSFADRRLASMEVRAWREAMEVMDALGVRPVSFGGYPFPVIKPLVGRMPVSLTAVALRRFVIGGRGGKKPSLLMDMERGKDRSEVMFLNGAVSSHGKRAGVPTSVNTCLTGMILSVVRGRVPWKEFRGRPDAVLDRCREENGGP